MTAEKPIVYKTQDQMPEIVMSEASMLWNRTGAWRYIRPLYCDKTPPCNQGCPAGNDIEGFLNLVEKEEYTKAWQLIKEENPFPRVCGRVCYHPCETACNRGQHDRAVAINILERFIGDQAPKKHKIEKLRDASGKKVAVIGAGPAGLTAAYHLARLGHSVVVYESLEKPGGILRFGIPEYRLPNEVLDDEIADVTSLGVEIKCKTQVGKDITWKDLEKFDSIFVATGVQASRKLDIENIDAKGVFAGLEFLRKVTRKDDVQLGPRTVVVGGGNTAVDAARSALRLGSRVTICYHRSQNEMPAFPEEVEEAGKEGVVFDMLSQPVRVIEDGGKVVGIEMRRTKLGEPDESGRRRPVSVPGSEYIIQATSILTAIGENSDVSFLPKEVQVKWGQIIIDEFGLSNHPGVFAGGDVALDNHNVAVAIGSGKAAALAIDSYLLGKEVKSIKDRVIIGNEGAVSVSSYLETGNAHAKNRGCKTVVSFDDININYFEKNERSKQAKLEISERASNFIEVHQGLSEQAAKKDSMRCFHCGVCTMCDNCYTYCPDIAIQQKGEKTWGYDIDFDYCKGCGVCVHECPRSAMMMEDEQ